MLKFPSSLLQVTIRLAPVLPTTVAVVHFPNVQMATEAVADVMNTGVGIRALCLLLFIVMKHNTEIHFTKRRMC